MKKISVKEVAYKCEFCRETSEDSDYIRDHEDQHRKVNNVSVGQKLNVSFPVRGYDWGHEYDSFEKHIVTVIEVDKKKVRLLVGLNGGERKWIEPWREPWEVATR